MATPEKILRYMWGYAPPLTIGAALENGVFDALAAGAKTIAETGAATGASERGLSAIMNALVGLELLKRDNAGRFSLTEDAAEFLVSSKPGYVGGLATSAKKHLIPKWLELTDVVRTGRPAESVDSRAQGEAFFEDLVMNLFPMNYPSACAAADALGVASAAQNVRVLDLAAGSGVWSIAMAQRSPWVTVTAVDWPGVLEITKRLTTHFNLADRYQFVAGDLDSADFGQGHHIAVLGHILHSEGETRSRALLRKTAQSMAPGGVIVIGEYLVDADRRGPVQPLIFGVNMLVFTETGNTYSFEEIRGWLEEAGFGNVGTVPAPGPSPLIFANRR